MRARVRASKLLPANLSSTSICNDFNQTLSDVTQNERLWTRRHSEKNLRHASVSGASLRKPSARIHDIKKKISSPTSPVLLSLNSNDNLNEKKLANVLNVNPLKLENKDQLLNQKLTENGTMCF